MRSSKFTPARLRGFAADIARQICAAPPHALIVIGQAPGRRSDPDRPLDGPGLTRLLSWGPVPRQLWEACACPVNLLGAWPGPDQDGSGDAFPVPEARIVAVAIERHMVNRRVLVLGRAAARAMSCPEDLPLAAWSWVASSHGGARLAVLPHPSGRGRRFHSPLERGRAGGFLRAALTEAWVDCGCPGAKVASQVAVAPTEVMGGDPDLSVGTATTGPAAGTPGNN